MNIFIETSDHEKYKRFINENKLDCTKVFQSESREELESDVHNNGFMCDTYIFRDEDTVDKTEWRGRDKQPKLSVLTRNVTVSWNE